jgi:predicted DNA-binding ribbon-helix-helix protein
LISLNIAQFKKVIFAMEGCTMKSLIVKRSIILNGHKTSVSLENEFWDGVRSIADGQQIKLSTLVQQIDRERTNRNLSSAIRIFVFNHFRAPAAGERSPAPNPSTPTLWPSESTFIR